MSVNRVRRRMFDRRSGVDRRRLQARIYWPDRRRVARRAGSDRRRILPTFASRPDRGREAPARARAGLASAAREWIKRFSR